MVATQAKAPTGEEDWLKVLPKYNYNAFSNEYDPAHIGEGNLHVDETTNNQQGVPEQDVGDAEQPQAMDLAGGDK